MDARLLILGATGFIGTALTDSFSNAGYDVTGIARDPAPGGWTAAARFLQADIADTSRYSEVLASAQTIIYAAGETVPGDSDAGPLREADAGLAPFVRLLQALRDLEGRHLVFVSSGGAIYGRTESTPVPEDQRAAPISYYGAGKAAMEAFLQVFASQTRNRVTILRPSNLYGAEQPKRPGFGLVRTVMECLAKNRTLTVWGDGSIARDYLHIADFTTACHAVVKSGNDQALRIFNVGFGQALSINEVCAIAERVSGHSLQREYQPPRHTDPERICLDIRRIRQACDWHPRISLETGISEIWKTRSLAGPSPE